MSILLGDRDKKVATAIIGSMKAKKSSLDPDTSYPTGDAPAEDSTVALEASMQSFASAMEKKDTKAMVSALKTFVSLCTDMEEPEEEME